MSQNPTYKKLFEELRRLDKLSAIGGILGWDHQVNLPKNSGAFRAETSAVFSELCHRESTRPEIGEWIAELTETDNLSTDEKVVVAQAKKDYDLSTKLPADFIKRRAIAQSEGYHTWTEAREKNDYASYAPCIEKHVALCKEMAAYMGRENDAYDFFVDQYDPGMDCKTIDALFTPLREELVPIVQQIVTSNVKADTSFLKGFDVDKQQEFLYEVVKALGLDLGTARIDSSLHPFCGGHTCDTRLTTRFDADNPMDSLFSVIHETGHALYQQGLPAEFTGTALGEAAGMAAHESQSRTWENQIARSKGFWEYWEPKYRDLFKEQLKGISSEQFYLAANKVALTTIRTDADEVTYNLHIMLRYELEKKLFSGELTAKDLPEAWNTLFEASFGFKPKDDREGVLQDVHWSEGMFGYFPSYCLGNLLSAQLWYAMQKDLTNVDAAFSRGEFKEVLSWMRSHVHAHGQRFTTKELCKIATGEDFTHKYLIRYLKERYLPLYS
jgi:carboxypeptidase Taq